MAKLLISKRIKFNKKGMQKEFINQAKELLKINNHSLAKELNISQRTLGDWIREKFNMSHESAKRISKLSHLPIPKDHIVIKWNDHLKNISRWGGRSLILKYGKVSTNEIVRKAKWREWWNETGKYNKNIVKIQTSKNINIPKKDVRLAEFVGIMLGDGGIYQYLVKITLSNLEKEYTQYVSVLIKKLFGVKAKVYKLKNCKAIDIRIQRKQLVEFCLQVGLVQGNKIKQQIDMPEWIRVSSEFSKECIRGLVDTDGCFYNNTYYSNNKKYTYLKIAFTSASRPLRLSVVKILNDLKIKASINHKDIRINDVESVLKYIKIIGSHNQKHLDKIKNFEKVYLDTKI